MRSPCFVLLVFIAAACTQSTEADPKGSRFDGGSSDAATPADGSLSMDGAAPPDASPVIDGAAPDATARDATTPHTPALCELPPEPGNCLAAIPRYAFNPKTQACEQFTYGGCGGNANNFERPLDCLTVCVTGSDAGPQKAACKVGDQVFASGATGITDPHSCNKCQCDDGQLICTEIACAVECPPDRKPSVGCAACGPVDNCELVEYGCFAVCDTEKDCQNTPYSLCLDKVCRNVCG